MFTNHRNSCVLQEIGVGKHDGDVRFLTESRNMAVLRMRNENYPNWPLFVADSPRFLHLIGNRGRGTRWWRQIFDRKSWTCELGYVADTMFHRTYFLFHIVLRDTSHFTATVVIHPICVYCSIGFYLLYIFLVFRVFNFIFVQIQHLILQY